MSECPDKEPASACLNAGPPAFAHKRRARAASAAGLGFYCGGRPGTGARGRQILRERIDGVVVDYEGTARARSEPQDVYGHSSRSGHGRAWTTTCDVRWFTAGQDAGLKQLRHHWQAAHR